jgi:putative chitinase
MAAIDASLLRAIAPKVGGTKGQNQAAIIAAVGPVLGATLADYQINSALRVAHFLAQCAQESDGFCTTQEYASGKAYEGRKDLGNTQPGDGVRYKGRGLIQLTGRFNYAKFGAELKLPLEDDPETAAQPALSLTIACEYWKDHNLNALADQDDIVTITKRINGGLTGIDDRRAYLVKAKAALAGVSMPAGGSGSVPKGPGAAAGGGASGSNTVVKPAGVGAPLDLGAVAASDDPLLKRGASGDDVVRLQNFLTAKGFPVQINGEFDADTENAVIQFQQLNKLDDDGVVGDKTWGLLRA